MDKRYSYGTIAILLHVSHGKRQIRQMMRCGICILYLVAGCTSNIPFMNTGPYCIDLHVEIKFNCIKCASGQVRPFTDKTRLQGGRFRCK